MLTDIAVLLSVGKNAASGRTRRADRDARALELALGLVPSPHVRAVHAGNPDEPALREYLGMGLDHLVVLALPAEADPVQALAKHMLEHRPAMILAGISSEAGEASGMVPYLVARALDWPLISAASEVAVEGRRAKILQTLQRGERRRIAVDLPAVITVDRTARDPRMSAFGRSRRGRIEVVAGQAMRDDERMNWTAVSAKRQPRRIKSVSGSAAERLRAISEGKEGKGELLVGPTPQEAARRILDFLLDEEVLGRSE